MRIIFLLLAACQLCFTGFSQSTYADSMKLYIKTYVDQHEVVKGDDKKQMHFFTVNEKYRVPARFEKVENGSWFQMPTSGKMKQVYRVYGVLSFKINNTPVKLNVYQSQSLMQSEQYKNYLFLPFTDATTGNETYESGRYIDISTADIKDNQVLIDFNKAYNPYCAYVSGRYNCPIPPKENNMTVAIRAGEKNYGKH
jgi:uncharacterized protein (DUF1684 family)